MTTGIDLGQDIDALKPGLIALRRELHQHPELAFEEVRPAVALAGRMRGVPIATASPGESPSSSSRRTSPCEGPSG